MRIVGGGGGGGVLPSPGSAFAGVKQGDAIPPRFAPLRLSGAAFGWQTVAGGVATLPIVSIETGILVDTSAVTLQARELVVSLGYNDGHSVGAALVLSDPASLAGHGVNYRDGLASLVTLAANGVPTSRAAHLVVNGDRPVWARLQADSQGGVWRVRGRLWAGALADEPGEWRAEWEVGDAFRSAGLAASHHFDGMGSAIDCRYWDLHALAAPRRAQLVKGGGCI